MFKSIRHPLGIKSIVSPASLQPLCSAAFRGNWLVMELGWAWTTIRLEQRRENDFVFFDDFYFYFSKEKLYIVVTVAETLT